jgi:hypothetical protein
MGKSKALSLRIDYVIDSTRFMRIMAGLLQVVLAAARGR